MTENEAKREIKEHLDIAGCEDLMCSVESLEMAMSALEAISKIKDIIREEERYEVSNSFDNPHPSKADYDAVHADKFNRIWKVVSEMKGE